MELKTLVRTPPKKLVQKALIKSGLTKEVIPWLEYPMTVQIDTTNMCGPKASGIKCDYCLPQWLIDNGLDSYGYMPMEQIRWIQNDVAANMPKLKGCNVWHDGAVPLQFIAYFLQGDPQNESPQRFDEFLSYHHAVMSWLPTQIFTSATRPEKVKKFCREDLDWICVTLSAPNASVYRDVMNGDRFDDVVANMHYLEENCYSNQHLEVHYVITEKNFPYIRAWFDFVSKEFPSWRKAYSGLLRSPDNEPSMKALGNLTVEQQENAIVSQVGKEYLFWKRDAMGLGLPCVLWGNCAINVHGEILQCCNWSKNKWTYGTVQQYMNEGRSLKDYWRERCANKQRNLLCEACNLKHPQSYKRLLSLQFKPELVKLSLQPKARFIDELGLMNCKETHNGGMNQ